MNRIAVVLALAALGGCLADENDIKASVGLQEDAGAAVDVVVADVPACEAPSEGFGTAPGGIFDANVVLKDCDGNLVRLADLMCGKRLTLVDIGAGWCDPCIQQAKTLDAQIYEPNKGKGLQVISILFEDSKSLPATAAFCKQWRADFGLTSPVLYDPTFKMKPYFTEVASSTPVNMLVDGDFRIIYKRSGEAPADLGQTIASELAK
ncbi:MAG: hypothetical protein AMXMBFR64_36350 [Myxococcales bacterium]